MNGRFNIAGDRGAPYRAFAAYFLAQAIEDLEIRIENQDSREYLESADAEILCEGIDIDRDALIEKLKLNGLYYWPQTPGKSQLG